MASKTTVLLQSSDGEEFEVDLKVARMFGRIKEMLNPETGGDQEKAIKPQVVPLPEVKTDILRKVILWVNQHQDDEEETTKFSNWDDDFFKLDSTTLCRLISAANYLDIKGLLEGSCKAVANSLKGKSPEEIREALGIVNDLTPAEEEQVRQELEWCEEK